MIQNQCIIPEDIILDGGTGGLSCWDLWSFF